MITEETGLFYYKSYLIEVDRKSKIGTVFKRVRNGADAPIIIGQLDSFKNEVDIVLGCFEIIEHAINKRCGSQS